MHSPLVLATIATLAAGATVAPRARPFGCGTQQPSAEHRAITQQLAAQEAIELASEPNPNRAPVVIDTYFHIIAASKKPEDGWVSEKQMADQLAVLNADFQPHGFSFKLVETTRSINITWASGEDELGMKKVLRKGKYDSLNLYFQKGIGLLGKCYFPANVTRGSKDFYLDGCSIASSTVPGGNEPNYNLGRTVTHEVGHWFGLYHTFSGGCFGDGDFVDDTPAMREPTEGCPKGKDTCPQVPGLDPIHNYMDYSYDSCYEEFTPGQRVRMHSYWNGYRVGK